VRAGEYSRDWIKKRIEKKSANILCGKVDAKKEWINTNFIDICALRAHCRRELLFFLCFAKE
jgi:hypothetical protein